MLAQPLAPLAAWPQFVAWRLEWNAERETWGKIPYSPIHGHGASSTKPSDWGTYEQALAFTQRDPSMSGIGFVFSERDPFWFLDIDKAWNGVAWSLVAQELIARLPGVAFEVSQSNTGIHLIGTGTPPADHKNKNIALGLELYTKERFVALTGTNATGSVSTYADLTSVVEQFFKRDTATTSSEWTTTHDPEWYGPEDDAELIERAMRSGGNNAASAFGATGGNPTFSDLFTGNVDALKHRWPPNNPGGDFDHSSADQSFANLLAFWCGRNCDRIERIMRMSALARSKWDTHPTYLEGTILKSLGLVKTVYKQTTRVATDAAPPPQPTEDEIIEAGFTPRMGGGRMLGSGQISHFDGCIYVRSLNKVLTPAGDLLDQARFNVEYGGHRFVNTVDGAKETTSAWTAYTENENFKPVMADRICFRPEEPSRLVIDAGKRLANTYVPAQTEEIEGDPAPFVGHVHKMLPNGRDAEILLTYMASVKQNPGMKSQWWPVVQGAQGNGKSSLLLIMAYAVGTHYAHLPNTEKMIRVGSNFNGWIERKLFLGLDEIHGHDRRGFFNGFKTTVTNLTLPIEGKGIEEAIGDNRANGMIVLNDQDGVPVTDSDRRYAVMFCAQQTKADMLRDGMTNQYFADFYEWLRGRGAYAQHGLDYGLKIINHYLANLQLSAEIDPNQWAIHAPITTSTELAIAASRGRVEQEIMEAIEEDRPGFAGGWVSSMKLEELMDRKKFTLARGKRRELMQTLGYDYHPALGDGGRVNSVVAPDNGKPRLYCKVGSIAWHNMTTPALVAAAYSDAQAKALTSQSAAAAAFK